MHSTCSNDIPALPPLADCGPASKMEEAINRRAVNKLAAEASGLYPYYAPPMTPWMEDYWAGRKMR